MIYHSKNLVLVRKGRAFYATLFQEVFFGNPGGGGSLIALPRMNYLTSNFNSLIFSKNSHWPFYLDRLFETRIDPGFVQIPI